MNWRIAATGTALIAASPAIVSAQAFPAQEASSQSGSTTEIVETDGGHRMGSAEAPVQLIEFVSYTCPHCADFEAHSDGALKMGYIVPGKVAVEVKHILRDSTDVLIAQLARCGPAEKFFGNHSWLMSRQAEWMANGRALAPQAVEHWKTLPPGKMRVAVARDLGLIAMMETRGYDRQELETCVADVDEAQRLWDQSRADGQTYGIPGTPMFSINGETLQGVHTWQQLEPLLVAAATAE